MIRSSFTLASCISPAYKLLSRLSKKQQLNIALACIMLCGLMLRLYMSADVSLHEWDERYHALVAKNLLKHFLVPTLYDNPVLPYNYTSWTANHIWLHKQPLALWLIALSIKVFGLSAFAVRIPAIVLSTIAIKLVYDIGADWYNKRVGLITAFLFSIHGLILELTAGRAGTDSVDVVFLFFIVLSVWLTNRAIITKRIVDHLLLGVSIGLAMLTKWFPALIVLPIWVITAYPSFIAQRGKMLACFLCIIAATIAIALPWQLYILHAFPVEARWEYAYNGRHFFQALEQHEGNFFFYFDHLRVQYGELIYLPIIWATWYGIKSRQAHTYALLLWFWIPYLFFSVAATKMEAYTLIAAPVVFMITALAFVQLLECIKTGNKYKYAYIVLAVALIALPIRYSIERIKPFSAVERNPGWNRKIDALRRSPNNSSKTIVANCDRPIETMFFTDCIAYDRNIDATTMHALKQRGYSVLLW